MKKLILIATIIIVGCASTNRPMRYEPLRLTEISILTPGVSFQKLSNETTIDSANFELVRKNIEEASRKNFERKNILFKLQNESISDSVQKIFQDAISRSRNSNRPDTINVNSRIQEILRKSTTRYAGYFYYTGFYRTGGNMTWGVTKGILIGIVTLGFYIPVPIKSSSTLYFIVFDRKNNKIAFDVSDGTSESPLDSENMDKQMSRIVSKLKT